MKSNFFFLLQTNCTKVPQLFAHQTPSGNVFFLYLSNHHYLMISFYFIYFHSVLIAGKKSLHLYHSTKKHKHRNLLAHWLTSLLRMFSYALFFYLSTENKGFLVMTDPRAIQVHHLHSVRELYQQSTVMVKCLPLMLQKLRPLIRLTIRFKWGHF